MVHNTDDAYNTTPKKFSQAGCNFTFYVGVAFILLGIGELAFGCTDAQKWDMFLFMAGVSWVLAALFFVFWYSYNLVLVHSAEDMNEDYAIHRSGERNYQPSRCPDENPTVGSRRRKRFGTPVSANKVVPVVNMVENHGFVEDHFDLRDVERVEVSAPKTRNNLKLVTRSRSNSNVSNISALKLVDKPKPEAVTQVFKLNM